MKLWLLMCGLWLFGSTCGDSLRPDDGALSFQWGDWGPWLCLCPLQKEVRIRHFVSRHRNGSYRLRSSDFWQERACSLRDCQACLPWQCLPESHTRQLQVPSSPEPHEVRIRLPAETELPPFDLLPSVDDLGQE